MKKNYLILALISSFFFLCSCGEKTIKNDKATNGEEYQHTGNPAVDKITKELAETPNNASLYAARGAAWYENENFDEGIADLEKAISMDSSKVQYYHVLADMYMDYYRSRLALNTMKKAAAVFPDRLPTLLKLAEFQLILEQHNDALFTLERIRGIDPLNAEMFYMFGRVFMDTERNTEAMNAFQSAVENDPELIDAWVKLADLISDKNTALAEKYYDNALRVDAKNIEALHAKAYYLSNKKNDLYGAIGLYKEINTVDPQYVDGYFNTGLIYLDMDSLKQAYQSFDIAVKYAPESPNAYYHRGVAAEMMGNKKQALADFKTVLNFDPEFASAKTGVDRLSQ